ncbi:MAG: DUF4391 domain-containing protein [Chlorobiaceae bacterium]|nr:DUF4391 domain-containing protein [Chlorobiaceae bacterium]
MNTSELLSAFDLPDTSRVNQRVPKRLLLENGAPTAADKRAINEGMEELLWLAALKPETSGVPLYREDTREYLEIAVLLLTLRSEARTKRLVELVHRAIPYPVLLLAEQGEQVSLSLAHKRWSQSEAGRIVLDGDIASVAWPEACDTEMLACFRESLALGRQPRANLHDLYQGWLDSVVSLNAAMETGSFLLSETAEHADLRRNALHQCSVLHEEIVRLRRAAEKEKQIPRQVELNLELKRLEAQLATVKQQL